MNNLLTVKNSFSEVRHFPCNLVKNLLIQIFIGHIYTMCHICIIYCMSLIVVARAVNKTNKNSCQDGSYILVGRKRRSMPLLWRKIQGRAICSASNFK